MKKLLTTFILMLSTIFIFGCSFPFNKVTTTTKVITTTTTRVKIDYPLDFKVESKDDDEFRILQISDPQIAFKDNLDTSCKKYIDKAVSDADPDLIIVVGDIVYGRYDTDGYLLNWIVDLFDSYGVPWAPIFGNHDNETEMGVDYQVKTFLESENCLFKRRSELSGNGNYSIGLFIGDELVHSLYMIDTKGCMQIGGDTKNIAAYGISDEQVEFIVDSQEKCALYKGETVKGFVAEHVMVSMMSSAVLLKYGTLLTKTNDYTIPEDNEDGDFGHFGETFTPQVDKSGNAFYDFVDANIEGIFCGHEHLDNASVIYEGIRMTYGLKSSTVDSFNAEQLGGTLITVTKDNFEVEHLYYGN